MGQSKLRNERLELRNAEGGWGAVPITRELLESWVGFFQPPDQAEFALFDPPIE